MDRRRQRGTSKQRRPRYASLPRQTGSNGRRGQVIDHIRPPARAWWGTHLRTCSGIPSQPAKDKSERVSLRWVPEPGCADPPRCCWPVLTAVEESRPRCRIAAIGSAASRGCDRLHRTQTNGCPYCNAPHDSRRDGLHVMIGSLGQRASAIGPGLRAARQHLRGNREERLGAKGHSGAAAGVRAEFAFGDGHDYRSRHVSCAAHVSNGGAASARRPLLRPGHALGGEQRREQPDADRPGDRR